MQEQSTNQALVSDAKSQTQAERILRDFVYRIATGQWGAGDRLPSIRKVRESWGVNQPTVQQAYGRLVEIGLAESRPRSGYYVTGGSALEQVSQHRYTMENLHRRVARMVRGSSELSVLGALRYLTHLEVIERTQEPEIAFVECTSTQAEWHAQEIAERLRVPVLPLTTQQIKGRRECIPPYVRCLLTSGFHLAELRPFHDPPTLTVAAVPIEFSPATVSNIPSEKEVLLLEHEEEMANHIVEDASRLIGQGRVKTILTEDAELELKSILESVRPENKPVVLLSPRVWGSVAIDWREKACIREAAFSISNQAWGRVSEAAGLPFDLS